MTKLNKYLSYLPYQKDEKNSPSMMEQADKKLSEMNMYNVIIDSMPPDLAMAYWAAKGSIHFPMCVQTLIEDLVPKEVLANA